MSGGLLPTWGRNARPTRSDRALKEVTKLRMWEPISELATTVLKHAPIAVQRPAPTFRFSNSHPVEACDRKRQELHFEVALRCVLNLSLLASELFRRRHRFFGIPFIKDA